MSTKIKKSFACAAVQDFSLSKKLTKNYTPKAGDVAVFQVLEANGSYVVDSHGINRNIFNDDLVMLAFGNRYATNQVEGYVPDAPVKECHLLGRGGVAGVLKSVNATIKTEPPVLELVAYAVNELGQVINTIRSHELTTFNPATIRSKVILSIGSSMDSGKTTTAAYLCGGLSRAGHTTAYIKLTGTAFPKDARYAQDRGADFITDFTQFGYPSTFLCEHHELLNLYQSLIGLAQDAVSPDYIVVEIADGILQRETAMLLRDCLFMSTVHSVILSCGDSLGVPAALQILESLHIYPFSISGLFTASELLIEEVQHIISTPVLRLNDLLNADFINYMNLSGYKASDLLLIQERA